MSTQEIKEELERTRAEMDSTLNELEERLRPSTLMENVMDSMRTGAISDYAKLTVERVKANPLAAALVGFGIGWLVVSPSRERSVETAHASALGKRAERLKSRVQDRAGAGDSFGARAGQGAGFEERAEGSVRGRLSGYTHTTRERTRRMQGSLAEMVDEHPVAIGIMALALGAAAAALIPMSRREDRWMGPSREDLAERARELGEEGVERARNVAEAAVDAAREQAQHEGLSREGVREEWASVKEKVEHVAEAAKDAAEEEAKRGRGD